MSEAVLLHESLLRAQELEDDAKALAVRKEMELREPPPALVTYPLRRKFKSDFDEAADRIMRWWNGRKAQRRGEVTRAEIEGLARKIRGMAGRSVQG